MTGGRRATDSRRKPQGNWRPTGTLSRRLARLILATALLSALVGAILSGISLTLEALGNDFRGGAVAAARQIAAKTGANAVRIYETGELKDSKIAEASAEGADTE